MLSAGAECPGHGRLHIPAFSQCSLLLPSGPTAREDNGGNDNITEAHKARAGRRKRSLPELITLRLFHAQLRRLKVRLQRDPRARVSILRL